MHPVPIHWNSLNDNADVRTNILGTRFVAYMSTGSWGGGRQASYDVYRGGTVVLEGQETRGGRGPDREGANPSDRAQLDV